jgi:hypothetical protein
MARRVMERASHFVLALCVRSAEGRRRVMTEVRHRGGNKLRIVTVEISGGRSLTRPFHDARRFPFPRWYPVPGATRTTMGFGICPSFEGHSLSRRAKT